GFASDAEADEVYGLVHCDLMAAMPKRSTSVRPREEDDPWPLAPASSTKRSMVSSRLRDIFDICSAEAASSVDPTVVWAISWRIFPMARTTAWAPAACSSTEELISCVISLSRVVALAICVDPCDCSLVAAPISCANL